MKRKKPQHAVNNNKLSHYLVTYYTFLTSRSKFEYFTENMLIYINNFAEGLGVALVIYNSWKRWLCLKLYLELMLILVFCRFPNANLIRDGTRTLCALLSLLSVLWFLRFGFRTAGRVIRSTWVRTTRPRRQCRPSSRAGCPRLWWRSCSTRRSLRSTRPCSLLCTRTWTVSSTLVRVFCNRSSIHTGCKRGQKVLK